MNQFALLLCIAGGVWSGCTTIVKNDGRTIATAVPITVASQSEVPAAEWAWIEANLPGARRSPGKREFTQSGEEIVSFAHSLEVHDGRTISVLRILMPDGHERLVYFDISGSFGK